MEKLKKLLPAILMILFEIAVGTLLLINPEKFTITVFIIFGAVLILCSLVMLIRYLKDRKAVVNAIAEAQKRAGESGEAAVEVKPIGILPLIAAIVTFVLGAMFAFGSGMMYSWTVLIVIFYGAIMLIKGIIKIADFVSLKKAGAGVSKLKLVVGILSVALGVVLIVFNGNARDVMFTLSAISLLIEAAMDIASLILGLKISKKQEIEAQGDEVEDDDPYHFKNFEK